jgi:hypothetical protein
MPSGRDSFRRNRVAPSVQLHFNTLARVWACVPSIVFRFSLKTSDRSEKAGGYPPIPV